MKKIDEGRLEWLERRQRALRAEEGRQAGIARGHDSRHRRAPQHRTTVISIPARVLAERDEDRGRLLAVLRSMLTALATPFGRVKLDFSRVAKMYPGGMLILIAYLELLVEQYPGRIYARCSPHSLPAQLLTHFGIGAKLGVAPDASRPRHSSVVQWRYLTGTVADGSRIAELLTEYRDITSAAIPEGLYEALTEALTNVRQHAYPPDDGEVPESFRRWWLFAKYEKPDGTQDGSLFLGVYDLGVGIQASMRKRLRPGEKLLDKAGEWLDWAGIERTPLLDRLLLHAAVERHRSSTGLSFRGNGLPEMREFVQRTESGRFSVVSGRAQYTCASGLDSGNVYSAEQPILGTLIVWRIPLEPKERTS